MGPDPGKIFDTRSTEITPVGTHWLTDWAFPDRVDLGRAMSSRPSERIAFLVHGLGLNEDYFGLLVPELTGRGYDVWALRLPGYLASGQKAGLFWPAHLGFSVTYYGWVVASAMEHLARTLEPAPTHVLAWGHSLGGVALTRALAHCAGTNWAGPDRLVFEAPAFGEALAFSAATVAAAAACPEFVLNILGSGLLMDDIRSSEFAEKQGSPLFPGRTSRFVFTLNALALANPFSQTPPLPAEFQEKSWFALARFDRLVDHDRLAALLDRWGVAEERRLVLPHNHWLSLTSAREMLGWVEGE